MNQARETALPHSCTDSFRPRIQGGLQLLVPLIAIAVFFTGVSGLVALWRLGAVDSQTAYVSPAFAAALILCAFGLMAAYAYRERKGLAAMVTIAFILLARFAPELSDGAWGNGRIQSVNLATALVVLGALMTLLLKCRARPARPMNTKLIKATILIGCVTSVLGSCAIIELDRSTTERHARATVQTLASQTQLLLSRSLTIAERLSERWSMLKGMFDRASSEDEFRGFLSDNPVFRRIAVIGSETSVEWEMQRYGIPSGWAVAESLTDPELRARLERAQDNKSPFWVFSDSAWQHGKSGLILAPLSESGAEGWFLLIDVDIAQMLKEIFARHYYSETYYFRITDGGQVIYQSPGHAPSMPTASGTLPFQFRDGLAWQISYWLTAPHLSPAKQILPEIFLLAGLLFTFLLAFCQRLLQISRYQLSSMRHGALHDSLTGLPNRRMLQQILKQACSRARTEETHVSIVAIGMDGTKLINDSMGHSTGDKLLIEVSSRLRKITPPDGWLARAGGDEFIVVLVGLADAAIADRTREMLALLAQAYLIDGKALRTTGSAGVRTSHGTVQDPMQLVQEAGLAMVRAKHEGRNTWRRYSSRMIAGIAKRQTLRNALQEAMDGDTLELHYQPIIEGRTGRITSVESLVRWTHPIHGTIHPSRLIPLAEETGQIIRITDWALSTACTAYKVLRNRGFPDLRIVVNISPLYFGRTEFVQKIRQVLQDAGLPGAALGIEITEGLLVKSKEEAVYKLSALRVMGVKTSIDDFGTGYSSLDYLKNLPVDKVKIDRSFVNDVAKNAADAAIAQGIISMAHHLGLKVVAEGIETEAQFRFLKRHHCDEFQGFLFARPTPLQTLADSLSDCGARLKLPSEASEPNSGRVLLLVDDEKNIVNALLRLLRGDGYEIITANSPESAFELLAKHRVQVVVCDQRMPTMNGTEFFGQVKTLYPDTIRIILSGFTEFKSLTEAINHGAVYKFITKPWDDDRLRNDIEEAFRRYELSEAR